MDRGIIIRVIVSGIAELLGAGFIVYGASELAAWLGWIVAGVAAVAVGWVIDPPTIADREVRK